MKWQRRIFGAACAMSLLVFVGTIGLAIRAQFKVDKFDFVAFHKHVYIGSFKRHFYGEIDKTGYVTMTWFHWEVDLPILPEDRFWEVRFGRTPAGSILIGIPHWLILLLSAPLPAWWLWSARSRRRRIAKGECLTCGYDLRASRERCPECGTAVPGHG